MLTVHDAILGFINIELVSNNAFEIGMVFGLDVVVDLEDGTRIRVEDRL